MASGGNPDGSCPDGYMMQSQTCGSNSVPDFRCVSDSACVFSCIGTPFTGPQFGALCSDSSGVLDDQRLSGNTPYITVDAGACTDGTKCEVQCAPPLFSLGGSDCDCLPGSLLYGNVCCISPMIGDGTGNGCKLPPSYGWSAHASCGCGNCNPIYNGGGWHTISDSSMPLPSDCVRSWQSGTPRNITTSYDSCASDVPSEVQAASSCNCVLITSGESDYTQCTLDWPTFYGPILKDGVWQVWLWDICDGIAGHSFGGVCNF